MLEERKILLERIRISRIEGMLKKDDEELRHELNIAILAKMKKLTSLRRLIKECKLLEENNK
ncbi:hypothetical protein KAU19_02605 [Candidatus Parcubacteria bacterium]|nr:hypothetical protein [Candidatus Parcubacteria bacterium]